MKIIDLSQKMHDKMPVHPYDDDVEVVQNKFLVKDKYNNTKNTFQCLEGTIAISCKFFLKYFFRYFNFSFVFSKFLSPPPSLMVYPENHGGI